MSIAIKLYTFSKRENSTAQPSGAGTKFDCVLKDETSIINPEILISTASLTSYNYAYISDFGRYYFIRDIVSVRNNLWRLSLECDVLATYKSQIGDSTEYVLRAASEGNEDIVDNLYPMTSYVETASDSWLSPFAWGSGTERYPSYIIGVINNDTNPKLGAVSYYHLTQSQMGALTGFLLGIGGYLNLNPTDYDMNYIKTMVNPAQYITECYRLPYDIGGDNDVDIKVGWWDCTGIQGKPVRPASSINTFSIDSRTITIPKHPAWDDGDVYRRYLRCYPFTQYTLYAGPFGVIQLDPAMLACSPYISLEITASGFGDAQLTIRNFDGDIVHRSKCNIKENYQLAQLNNNPLGFWTGVASTAVGATASAVASNPAGVAGSVISGIGNMADALYPKLTTSGSFYTQAEAYSDWALVAEFHYPVENDPDHRGYPLCKVKAIEDLSGYILVADPDIAISGTQEENEKIKAYMAGGFYYE